MVSDELFELKWWFVIDVKDDMNETILIQIRYLMKQTLAQFSELRIADFEEVKKRHRPISPLRLKNSKRFSKMSYAIEKYLNL